MVSPLGQVVVGHGEVEHAAVGEVDRPPGPRPCRSARAHDRGAPAVAQRAGHDLGGARAAAVHEHDHRDVRRDRVALGVLRALGRLRPRTDTISPSSMKMLDTSTASRAARRRCRAGRARCPRRPASSSRSISRRRTPCAPALKPVSRTTPTLLPVARRPSCPSATGTSIRSRFDAHGRGASPSPPGITPRGVDLRARRALDARRGHLAVHAGDRAAVHRHDEVACA